MRTLEAQWPVGTKVKYVPNHAFGDAHHPDCEAGYVSSVNHLYVFVRFKANRLSGQACDPATLILTV